MKKYTTVQGDMWDSIAYATLGDAKYADILMQANKQYRQTYIFTSGIVLTIPDIDTTVTYDDLPPWKRVLG